MKRPVLLLGALLSMNVFADEAVTGSQAAAVPAKHLLDYHVSNQINPSYGNRYYLIQNGDTWSVSRTGDLKQKNVERIMVNIKSGEITLDARPGSMHTEYAPTNNYEWECYQGLGSTGFRNDNNYSICSSELAKGVTEASMAVIGSLNLLFGTVRRILAVDQDKIMVVAQSSGLLDMVDQDIQAGRTAIYHQLFTDATSPHSIGKFIDTYQNNDPEGLVPQARTRMQQAKLDEYRRSYQVATSQSGLNAFVDTYADNDPDLLVPKARKHIKELQAVQAENERQQQLQKAQAAKLQAEQQMKERQQVLAFQKSLKAGDETNCGPVIATQPKLVQVSFPVSGYGNEHWIRRDQIYPASYNCRFFNGAYQTP